MTLRFPLLKKDFENGAFICQETLRCDSYTFVICPRILPDIIMNRRTIPVEVDILLLFTIFSHPDGIIPNQIQKENVGLKTLRGKTNVKYFLYFAKTNL